ncbi:hypothetical protein Cgig2_008745 [Carnegiea gigantea]|uniref:Uncharacterized protein n=1 Tax=Carnegiea gigantea TaxID=171969 RepID=A0A9Q1JUH9_9CARY|nr:hypothetical protein Cgig2_008745 [Carnegiea gigantea]
MAVPTTSEVPLLENHSETEEAETQPLKHSLKHLETFLRFLGFFHDSSLSFSLSSLSFLLIGIAAPSLIILLFYCGPHRSTSRCDFYHVKTFELEVLIWEVAVAAVSLFCISRNLRKYGLRKFLFVDKFHGNSAQFQDQYRKISLGEHYLLLDGTRVHRYVAKTCFPSIGYGVDFFRMLAVWVLPCFVLKTAKEFVKVIYVGNDSWLESLLNMFILLVSWAYSAIIYLSGSSLFSLVCNLQVIHFENYRTLLERDLDVLVYIQEHIRLTFHLSKISHRFRIFLILEFLIVTASQFVALLETTGSNPNFNFINGADFAVVGIIICLHAAAKMSHRAQGLASFASRWHAFATCNSNETLRNASSSGNLDTSNLVIPVVNYSESDLESADYVLPPTNVELAAYMSSYHKRQAFVMYLQSNPGGVTLFGWTVDRALMNTIFFIELSVVTFVLGKTISFSTGNT